LTDEKEKDTRDEQENQRVDSWEFFWGRRPRSEEESIEEE